MEFSVHRPSPPNTYSYVREENQIHQENLYKITYCLRIYLQPYSCNTHADPEWA